jgi:tetratricopeptide (TPR) repeat protein
MYASAMEQEALATLQSIRTALYWLIAGVALLGVVGLLRLWFAIREDLRSAHAKVFQRLAGLYLEEGKLKELVDLCEAKLRQRPNHAYALWYLGRAHYLLKDYDKAKPPLQKLAEVEPGWDAGYVQPILDQIDKIETTLH